MFCKGIVNDLGSPEMVSKLCKEIPSNFQKIVDEYSLKGLRILAMAYKSID